MVWIIGVLVALLAISLAFNRFTWSELYKKFHFDHIMALAPGTAQTYFIPYRGADLEGFAPNVRKVVLRSNAPFVAQIGFRFDPMRVDYFGTVTSDANGEACFATYLGRGSTTFIVDVKAVVHGDGFEMLWGGQYQDRKPSVTFPPHWFQRLGIFG